MSERSCHKPVTATVKIEWLKVFALCGYFVNFNRKMGDESKNSSEDTSQVNQDELILAQQRQIEKEALALYFEVMFL